MTEREVDVLIVGGGLTGATLMLALTNAGFSTLLVEAQVFDDLTHINFNARSLALSPASVKILEMLNIWPILMRFAVAINEIHVSEQGSFGSVRLRSDENIALGYVVEMQYISAALHQLLHKKDILSPACVTSLNATDGSATIMYAERKITVRARLIVAADGAQSLMRTLCKRKPDIKDYKQYAVVANIGLARSHNNTAYERFSATGPLALLPLPGLRSSLVWAVSSTTRNLLMSLSDDAFIKELQTTFGYRLGRFVRIGQRTVYPLQQVLMPETVVGRVVFVGNAAQTLHPVAGQGFNLGLRDVAMLAQCIIQEGFGANMLNIYQQSRRQDVAAITHFTAGLIKLFTSKLPLGHIVRGAGLFLLDINPQLQNALTRVAQGFAGITPDLACGISLRHEEL